MNEPKQPKQSKLKVVPNKKLGEAVRELHIKGNPTLWFAFRTAVENVKEGKMTPEEFADLLKKGTKEFP